MDAAEKIKVDYDILPSVVDTAQAQAGNAPQIHEVATRNTIYQWHLGDAQAVEAAFKAAKHVTKLDLLNNRLVPNAIEPRAAIAEYDGGSKFLRCGTPRKIRMSRVWSYLPLWEWRPSTVCA